MPLYEQNVVNRFADLVGNKLVHRGSRPVFWSVSRSQILAEDEFEEHSELRDCTVTKMKVTKFGKKAEQLRRLYPEAKLLVFTDDAWKLAGA